MVSERHRQDGGTGAPTRQMLRLSSAFTIMLGAVLSCLVVALAYRLELTWELPVGSVRWVSERTRNILAETQGSVKIVCFMDRRHPMFRPLSRLLRGFREASRGVAGAELTIETVDPRWDLTRAGQLAASGVPENAVVFERLRRRIVVTLDEMLSEPQGAEHHRLENGERTGLGVFRGEMVCASAISRLSLPYERPIVYWLRGHGEALYENYDDVRGFSDIAREMNRDGYDIRPLSLPGLSQIPSDCHVLLVAGPRRPLAAEECVLVEAFLQRGGRMLVLVEPHVSSGLEPLLEKWGIRLTPFIAVSPKTLSGTDAVVSSFADHPITRNLGNVSVVFGSAVCLLPVTDGAASEGAADRPKVTLIAQTDASGWGESYPDVFPRHFDAQSELRGPVAVAAVSERGGAVAKDVAYQATRICVFGETDFVMNGALAARANANRDLFMNALAWLAGIDSGTASSLGGDATLVTAFSRRQWVVLMAWAAGVVPAVFFAFLVLLSGRRRR